jgi:hypothetical protein
MMAFPANRLESVLADMRAGSGSADQLLQALADSELWVPLPGGTGDDGEVRLPVTIVDEQPYVVVYTSDEQYARGAGQHAHMVLGGRELAEILADELGLAVNPGGEAGLPIRPEGVRSLRSGQRTIRAGEQVRLGAPARARAVFEDLLHSHANPWVQFRAAAHLLNHHPATAIRWLRRMAYQPGRSRILRLRALMELASNGEATARAAFLHDDGSIDLLRVAKAMWRPPVVEEEATAQL